jgi:hypothetical protein
LREGALSLSRAVMWLRSGQSWERVFVADGAVEVALLGVGLTECGIALRADSVIGIGLARIEGREQLVVVGVAPDGGDR